MGPVHLVQGSLYRKRRHCVRGSTSASVIAASKTSDSPTESEKMTKQELTTSVILVGEPSAN